MKIKSILAISAFAASMSAFAQSEPQTPGAGAKQPPRTSADRESIRNTVKDFHEQHPAPRTHAEHPRALPPMPTSGVADAPDGETVRTAAVRREQLRKSLQRQEQRQAWEEKRELVSESKHLRMQKRQERQLHTPEHVEAVAETPQATGTKQ